MFKSSQFPTPLGSATAMAKLSPAPCYTLFFPLWAASFWIGPVEPISSQKPVVFPRPIWDDPSSGRKFMAALEIRAICSCCSLLGFSFGHFCTKACIFITCSLPHKVQTPQGPGLVLFIFVRECRRHQGSFSAQAQQGKSWLIHLFLSV